jgi:hypothetical protein
MKMNLKVAYNDKSATDVTVSVADFVAFEEKFDRSVAKFDQEFKLTDMCWLAWHRLAKTDKNTGDFNDWLEKVDNVEFEGTEEIVPLEEPTTTTSK